MYIVHCRVIVDNKGEFQHFKQFQKIQFLNISVFFLAKYKDQKNQKVS